MVAELRKHVLVGSSLFFTKTAGYTRQDQVDAWIL